MRKKDTVLIIVIFGILLICTGLFAWWVVVKRDQKKETKEDICFNWYINYEWYNDEWKDSEVAQAITEKTGVTVNFKTPVGNSSNTLDTLIASNELPDMITLGYWDWSLLPWKENL